MRYLPLILILLASPAFGATGSEVAEPSSMALFGLAVLGVLVGRQAARRGPRSDED